MRTDVIRDLAALPEARRTEQQVDEALIACAAEIERLREALMTAAIRLSHLGGQIEAGAHISGTLRAEQAMKARHMSDEARAALGDTQ